MKSDAMRKKIVLTALVLLVILFGFNACIETRETAQSLKARFPNARVEVLNSQGHNLGYMSIHRHDTLPTLFFLHGSPSSLSVYNSYYEDTSMARWANIIAADRPGYGFSEPGMSEKSVRRQAKKMWNILEEEGYPSPLYIIGSSYGGTVAAKMAMLKPEKVDGVVLISASLAPGEETTYDISYLIQYSWVRWLLPPSLMVANDEKLSHFESLQEMSPLWSNITAPVILFQGTNDRLIFPENVNFARRKLINSRFVEYHMLENERHFLQLKYKDLILERLRNLVQMKSFPKRSLADLPDE
jgi:pimeloyl-ACP methyl ester carboxylesterase